MKRMKLLVGTSGFSYDEWKGSFYPAELPKKEMLAAYAARLPAVELNNTFYRMPRASVVDEWLARVEPFAEFRFVVKASRRITHFKALKGVEDELGYLLTKLDRFGDRLGALLFQLPPTLERNHDRLAGFLALLPDDLPAAFEFRHESWLGDARIERLLRDRNAALVGGDDEDGSSWLASTADWGYLRFRRDDYADFELRSRAAAVLAQAWRRAFVFFKHEEDGAGPPLARAFLEAADAKPVRKQAPSKRAARAARKTG